MNYFIKVTTECDEITNDLLNELEENAIKIESYSDNSVVISLELEDPNDKLDKLYIIASCLIYSGLEQFKFEALCRYNDF